MYEEVCPYEGVCMMESHKARGCEGGTGGGTEGEKGTRKTHKICCCFRRHQSSYFELEDDCVHTDAYYAFDSG